MSEPRRTLVCWHSERNGPTVLENMIELLRRRKTPPSSVLYLVQRDRQAPRTSAFEGIPVEVVPLTIGDPTHHHSIYEVMRREVCPRLRGQVDVNLSPGTPAMHAVWLVLAASGLLPPGSRLWSSQVDPVTREARLDRVEFPLETYLGQIRRRVCAEPEVAAYDPEPHSRARQDALERLHRYARVAGAPLLLLGERGVGKTRLVERHVAALKGGMKVVAVPCGGLESTLAESLLFGHRRGAFTGATEDRPGLLAEANGGILFLDEIQDLPATAQRRLVRVLQDRLRRYRRLGDDAERTADMELVCASNLALDALRERLDADLFDRVSHLMVVVPPLRACREDLRDDWGRVWRELRRDDALPPEAPWSLALARLLETHPLPGNLRDLQRLALLLSAWLPGSAPETALEQALTEWQQAVEAPPAAAWFGDGSRKDRLREFQARLAIWAKERWGTWSAAAAALACDERTLRDDAAAVGRPSRRSAKTAR